MVGWKAAQGAIQFDATGCPSEVYDWQLELTSTVPGGFGSRTSTIGGKLALVNLADSPYGRGWFIQGLEPTLFTTLPTAAPSGPRLRRFTWSRILTGQASTPAVRSVAKRRSHWAGRPLATEGW